MTSEYPSGIPKIPRHIIAFLVVCLISIPFSAYPWKNVQFLLVNCVCVAAYLISSGREDRTPILVGYVAGALALIAFGYSREIVALQWIGPNALRMRLAMVQFHNDLAPTLILLTAMLLYFRNNFENPRLHWILTPIFPLLAILLLLTYSRNGCIAYLIFAIVYKLRHGKKAFLVPVVCAVCSILVLGVVREQIKERLTSVYSFRERVFNWKAGLATIAEHPVFGVGWHNYYTHTKLPEGISTFENLYRTQKLISVQTHSMFLDLAEAGGIVLAGIFLYSLIRHLRISQKPSLTACIAGLTFLCAADSACLWLPAYPHLWILLGFAAVETAKPTSPNRRRWYFLIPVFLFALLMLAENRSLRLSSFYHMTNNDEQALTEIRIAGYFAPLDTAPLEQLKEIYLTRGDSIGAIRILNKLMSMKKDYAPYYTELGRLEMLHGNLKESAIHFETAVRLDPYSGQDGNPYFYLTLISQRLSNPKDFETYRNRSFLLRFKGGSLGPAKLFWNEENLKQVLQYTDSMVQSTEDWATAMGNIYQNCTALGNSDLAVQVLEHALQKKPPLPDWMADDLVKPLADLYAGKGQPKKIPALMGLCTKPVALLIKIRMEFALNQLRTAYQDLQSSLQFFGYDEIQPLWTAYYIETRQLPELRKHFEIMEKLPIPFSPLWRELIAKSYLENEQYESAAKQFHRLSQYRYDTPRPHWCEARVWWLAGNPDRAKDANDRLQRLIASNWFTANLYRSEMKSFLWDGSGILNVGLPNSSGGRNWRTALFVHPEFQAVFPKDRKFSRIRCEVALMGDVWDQDTDGVVFQILNPAGNKLFSMSIDPKNNLQQQRWNPFEWNSSIGPQAITLNTQPRANPSYDWAVWAFGP